LKTAIVYEATEPFLGDVETVSMRSVGDGGGGEKVQKGRT